MTGILDSPEIDALATLAEEVARSTKEGVKRFVEPASGTLRRAKSARHHLVFGRRGSGKTSLLSKAAHDLEAADRPIAFVDLEPFKGHSYPDVLISVLIVSFGLFKTWVETAAERPEVRRSLRNLFGLIKSRGDGFDAKAARELSKRIEEVIEKLKAQLRAADGAALQRVTREEQESSLEGSVRSGVSVPSVVEATSRIAVSDGIRSGEEVQERYQRSKIDFLRQSILEYQGILGQLSRLSSGSSYLFFDDLHYIPRRDQPRLLDYFHAIAKGNDAWLKIGTIHHRSQWYIHGDPPSGLKLGDDAEAIDLDLTLDSYAVTKEFLITVLNGLVKECSAPPIGEFMATGAVDRLVLASGGVARDFLGLFWRSISEARERLKLQPRHHRGPKIGAEDVNLAAGTYGDRKLEEFRRDALDDQQTLEEAFGKVREFCIIDAKANCFLLDHDASGDGIALIQELVDLRLLHLVRPRVTVSGRTGEVYRAYLLDVSQYTGSRARRGFEMVDFWRKGRDERLRRVSLIYDPSTP